MPAPKFSRREQLIHAGLKPGADGFFSRAIINRLWYRFLGTVGDAVGQLHGANRPSHRVTEWLARDLVGNEYNLRRTIRGLVLSEAYARSRNGAIPAAVGFHRRGSAAATHAESVRQRLDLCPMDPENSSPTPSRKISERIDSMKNWRRLGTQFPAAGALSGECR